jgi:DMSO/TMAO reductase YedYZ molybdopterin-dependent catalytic subunit
MRRTVRWQPGRRPILGARRDEDPDVSSFRVGTRMAAAGAGILAAGAGVATSALVASLFTGLPTPLVSVGNAAVDLAPAALKDFAVSTFGTADKAVLLGGIYTVLAVVAATAGLLGLRRPRLALAVTAGLGGLALVAAATDRTSMVVAPVTLLPAGVALAVSLATLAWLLRALARRHDQPAAPGLQPHPGDDVGADFDRRAFLEAVLTTAAAAAAAGVATRLVGGTAAIASRAQVRLPPAADPAGPVPAGADLRVSGMPPYLTPNAAFYRIDTALDPPDVPAGSWSLRIHGLVDNELELDFPGLLRRRLVERRITLTCVSNEVGGDLIGNARWLGVPLAELLDEAGVQDGADALLSTSADGFTVGTPIAAVTDGRDALLAIGMNGAPLPIVHGFPARLVVPGLYGYVSATKWVTDIEVTRFDEFSAYWTDRGWAEQAPIKTASRIDVPAPDAELAAGRHAVAGVAWAQGRGIERVEVRVDDGDWRTARLGTEDGQDTWRQWVYAWDAEPGRHTLTVRATDTTGQTQPSDPAPPRPDGATGWHTRTVDVS